MIRVTINPKPWKAIKIVMELQVVSATFVLVYFLSLIERTCQTKKKIFHFISKALFVLEKIIF